MRFKKITFIFLVTLLSMYPLSLRGQVPPSFETLPRITEAEVKKFLEEYIAQYVKMDIDAFMTFFSKEAIENRMLTYPDIREIYRGTFDNSDSLRYHLEIYSVQTYGQSASVIGRYEVHQTIKGSHIRKVFRGNIQWDLLSEDGSLKIREINYGRDYAGDRPSHPYP
jgi:Domain of unknown function (DUF4440)